jgi:adenylate cyclase
MFPVALVSLPASPRSARRSIRDACHYLTPSVMERVLADPGLLGRLGGALLGHRGFTSVNEELAPSGWSISSTATSRQARIVFTGGGTLDEYIGDAIKASSAPPAGHALRACRTACDAHQLTLRQGWRDERPGSRPGAEQRADGGGNMGSHARFDYTVMGDAVNLDSRLEG